jgi:hypothetical protein
MVMCGDYFRRERDDAANGLMSSACCAEPSVDEYDGYGTPRTTSGPKFTPSIKSDGSMSTLAKKLGITLGSTRKDGARRCRTALPSQRMAQQTSLVATSERQSMHSSATSVPKKSYFTSPTKSETFDDPIWLRTSASDWKRKTARRTKSFDNTSFNRSLSPSSPLSDLAWHRLLADPSHQVPTTRNCPQSSPPADKVVPRNGSTPEGRTAKVANHQETHHTGDYEQHQDR